MLLRLPRKSSLTAYKTYHKSIISAELLCWSVWFFRDRASTYLSEPKAKHSGYHMRSSMTDCYPNVWIYVEWFPFVLIVWSLKNLIPSSILNFWNTLVAVFLVLSVFNYTYFCQLSFSTLLCIFWYLFRGLQEWFLLAFWIFPC